MGDSSVSCALSGFTLQGEDAIFIPLVEASYSPAIVGSRLGWKSTTLYAPYTLPYRIRLDDYSRAEFVYKDKNTDLIERHLSKWGEERWTIEEFTKACIFGENIAEDKSDEKQVLGRGCFIHPEVYAAFSKPIKGGKDADSLWDEWPVGKINLKVIGCKFVEDLGEDERYRYLYKHPDIPNVSFYFDGSFTNFSADNGKRFLLGHRLSKMHTALVKAGFAGFPKPDIKKAKSISSTQTLFILETERLVEDYRRFYRVLNLRKGIPPESPEEEMISAFEVARNKLRYLHFLENVDNTLLTYYLKAIHQGEFLKEAADLKHVLEAFNAGNKLLIPSICAEQYPDHSASVLFNKKMLELAKQRLKDHLG